MPLETLDLDKITTLEDALLVIRELVFEVVTLRAENTELRSENTKLRERIAKLEKNSSNSSKPPSSDITKPESEQRQVGKRKIGAQPGHKGNFRRKFSPEEIDHREKLKPLANCPECRTKLEPTEEVQIYQQAELVDRPVVITEYQLPGSRCPCCKKTFYPELPLGVIQGQLLGPKVLSLFGYMKAAMGVSISELAEFSKDVLKLDICRGAIQKAIFRVSDALKPAYEELAAIIPEQQALNVDETGWKQNGSRHWASLFRFLDSPELYEPTNNLAERTLRHLVRLRRISFGSRGKNGSEWTQRAASIIATCKLQKKSAWEFFQHAVLAKACGGLAPALISRA